MLLAAKARKAGAALPFFTNTVLCSRPIYIVELGKTEKQDTSKEEIADE
jgi:hypothetical protein